MREMNTPPLTRSSPISRVALSLCFIAFYTAQCLSLVGCTPPERNEPVSIEGVVAFSKGQEIIGSFMLEGYELGPGKIPVSNADVYLSFDRSGERRVPNSMTRSDEAGRYRIELHNPQPPESPDGYYIHVLKAGFEPLSRTIRLGTYTPFKRNSVILKPIPLD